MRRAARAAGGAWRFVRPVRIRLTWLAFGWAGAFLMALCGSKLHGLWEDFVTWLGASREQRAQMRRTKRLKHFDVGRQT